MYSTKKCRKPKEKDKSHKKEVPLKKKNKKTKAKDDHLSYDSKSESNEDIQIDFNEELHPIGYYVKDRAEMINQMFNVIQGKKLRAMLPPILKAQYSRELQKIQKSKTIRNTKSSPLESIFFFHFVFHYFQQEGYSVDELKSLCLEELLGMSEKRIMSVLEGRELETSSESEVHSSELETEEKFAEADHKENWCSDAEISSTTKNGDSDSNVDNDGTNDAGDMDTLEIGITREEMGELLNDMSCGKTSQRKRLKEKRCDKPLKHRRPETTESLKSKRKASEECTSKETFPHEQEREEDATDKEDKNKGKTLLEILELEMRARAIRALLKQQGEEEGNTESDNESDKLSTDAITTDATVNEVPSTDVREKSPNPVIKKEQEDAIPQPKRRCKEISEHLEKNNLNTDVISGTDNNDVEMDLVSTTTAVVDLTKEKVNVKPSASEPSKSFPSSHNDKTSSNSNKNSTSKTGEVKDIAVTSENRTALDKAKKRCYRSNQEEGEISSDDENKSDAGHTVNIESESDFDVITLDDSNDSISSLPRAERHVTIEKSNVSKLTSVSGATNQKLYSEILRSNIKVYVKNKGKLKTRDIHVDTTSSSWSKNPKKGSEENRDEEQNKEIEDEDAAPDMTWAARWLKSKGVQKVVKTSKMCAKMRKRMKNAHKKSQLTTQDTREESKSPPHIIGSVKEYQMLDKPKVSHSDSKQKLSEEKQ